MIEYLIRILKEDQSIAVISRGYKRKTKGYVLADDRTTALEIGDEPMQIKRKYPFVAVAVGESRVEAIPQLLQDCPNTSVILLDDAFQHRAIRAGLSIVLTDYSNLFTRDFLLPSGDLRDQRSSYKRADILIVTKCPATITQQECSSIRLEIDPLQGQDLLFSSLEYGSLYPLQEVNEPRKMNPETGVLLVTGIANPSALKNKLQKEQFHGYEFLSFSDHHIFTIDDIQTIRERYHKMEETDKLILTTEKDAVRLMKFKTELNDLPMYILPVEHKLLFDGDAILKNRIYQMMKRYKENG